MFGEFSGFLGNLCASARSALKEFGVAFGVIYQRGSVGIIVYSITTIRAQARRERDARAAVHAELSAVA